MRGGTMSPLPVSEYKMAKEVELSGVAKKKKAVKRKAVKRTDPDKPKKKKKKSTDVAVPNSYDKVNKSLLRDAKKQGDSLDQFEASIEKLVAERPQIKEDEQFLVYYQMFKSVKKLSKKASKKAMESPTGRNIYPLIQLYNQLRELVADIRALKNITELTYQIDSDVLIPYTQEVSAIYMEYFQQVREIMTRDVPPELSERAITELKIATKASGVSLQSAYANALQITNQVLADQ